MDLRTVIAFNRHVKINENVRNYSNLLRNVSIT